jgi:hypothetical protein
LGTGATTVVHQSLNVVLIFGELLHRPNRLAFIDGDISFAGVRERALHVRPDISSEAMNVKSLSQGGFSRLQVLQQLLQLSLGLVGILGTHGEANERFKRVDFLCR